MQVEPCPFCGKPAEAIKMLQGKDLYRCSDKTCPAHACIAKLEEWNKRP